jgi:hypothetical protein
MPPTRIFHNYTKLPIISVLVLTFCNYELYRVVKGTHPYISVRVNGEPIAGGLNNKETISTTRTELKERVENAHRERKAGTVGEPKPAKTEDKSKSLADRLPKDNDEERWIMLNGIPIPSFGLLMSPWRRD